MKTPLIFIVSAAAILVAAPLASQVRTNSMVQPGKPAPDFTLNDINDQPRNLRAMAGKYVVLEWTNKDCPYVKKHYSTGNMQDMQKKSKDMNAVWWTIDSTNPGDPGYMSSDDAKEWFKSSGSNADAYLFDPGGKIGKGYGIKSTPQIVVIDPKGKVVYNGAVDDKPTTDAEDVPKAHNYALTALWESFQVKPVSVPITTPYGCDIVYSK